MTKRIALLFAAALGLMAGIAQSADSLAMADFAHSIKLMVDGYTGTETLQNFPVLVRVSEAGIDGFKYSDLTNSKGKDIAFFDEAGNHLASEIETNTWKEVDNTSLIWVKLPQMTQGTKFFMCYNTTESGAWVTNENPWGDYVGVWHMDEKGGLGTTVYDATANALNGAVKASGSSVTRYKNGAVGATRRIAADKNHDWGIVVDATNGTKKVAADSLGTDFSASFWMNPQASAGNITYGFLIDRRKGEYNDPGGWGLRLHTSPQVQIYAATEKPFSSNYDGTLSGKNYADLFTQNTWTKVDVHWYATNINNVAKGAADIYLNGVFKETVILPNAPLQDNANIGIGGSVQLVPGETTTGKGRRFNGYMDEVRLRPGVPSADWVKADYDTVNNAAFVTVAPPEVLTVAWANAGGETPGVAGVAYNAATFGGTVQNHGEADTCAVEYKLWTGETEPEAWTTLTGGLVQDDAFSIAVSGLASATAYHYALRAVGNDGEETDPVSGAFTTLPALEITWSEESGVTGFSKISYNFATIGGTITALGGATTCDVQYKVWAAGESEPDRWTNIATDRALGDAFGWTVSELSPGTAYNYALRAVGNDGEEAVLSGAFTTRGEEGEELGSPKTHFFDDGTNAYWVVNDYERYLDFTVTGYTGTETLTNFPVLVDVRASDTNGFSYDDFYHFDGSAIAFVDEKGHIIPHEIDTWNRAGMSLIWVRLPEMNNGTTFTMCYRSAFVDPASNRGNTFEKYVGVWHMNETQNGVVELKDSTTNNLAGETHAQSLAGVNKGQMIGGNARRVAQQPGSSMNYGRVLVFDHDDILRTGVGNVFTYSGWYQLLETPPKWSYLVARKMNDQDRGWGIQYDETSTTELRVWSGSRAKGGFQKFNTSGAAATGWNYWTFIYDGSVNGDGTTNRLFHAYLNGQELASTEGGFALSYDVANDETADYGNLVIGGQQTGTGAFNGYVDEVRYSKGMRSADWIKAEYDSMRQKDVPFVTKGTQVGRGEESLVPVIVWERGAGLPDTILDLSYAYVQFAGYVSFCGAGAKDGECRIEYLLWADGEEVPAEWTTLKDHLHAGDSFSVPVTGLKQDMPYNFRIRAVNMVWSEVDQEWREQSNREHVGTFRTHGNVNGIEGEGELMRIDNKFVYRFRAGTYNFTTPDYVTNVEIMVVGGGGGGGYKVGGGGGGGGLFYSASFPVSADTAYRVHVGRGGTGATNLTDRAENGEISYFALARDEEHPLIRMHGGGGGGSYKDDATIAKGGEGASGGGGTYAFDGGAVAMLGLPEEERPFGNAGGGGNDALSGGSTGKTAAGGGGGAGRAGLTASFDSWWGGGAGGGGLECGMSGETLFYGAGGGGGYKYKFAGEDSFTKPGAGGSGIGGNAADVRNGIPATSGIANTGAGGGGGSMTENATKEEIYWKGGDGGDGVVLIAYEIHGRDPISEEPRITMTLCDYTDEKGYADIGYRAYWAGVQSQLNDLYVLYSTESEEDVAAGNGTWVKVESETIAIGSTVFTPPEVGHTYWVRLVARKAANSFMYSDEIASFEVPAIRNNGATWHMPAAEDTSQDYATIFYNLYYMDADAHLYLYWSETREDLEGDAAPSGAGVHFLDLGTGMQKPKDSFTLPASEGLERNKVYYTRVATGNEAGTKFYLSPRVMVLETIDKPRVIFPEATWANNVATIKFLETTANLDPATVELRAYYSTNKTDVSGTTVKDGTPYASLGSCALYPDDVETFAQFPLWSKTDTRYYVKLALAANGEVIAYSQRYQELDLIKAIPDNTILVYVKARPELGCYGDDPNAISYEVEYAGYTDTVGAEHLPAVVGAPACEVTSASPSGQYDIDKGTLALTDGGAPYLVHAVYDEETGELVSEEEYYYYALIFAGAKYVVTNAAFTAMVQDAGAVYTGEPFDTDTLVHSETGVRNGQPVSYLYRIGTNDWTSAISAEYADAGTQSVRFKASAPNHDDVTGTFTITIEPAPLFATVSAVDMSYTGGPLSPSVTTNVTGLVHGDKNALSCAFRDAAGEWQATVPATFTQPGEYTLFFRASAPNHAPYTTNCTFRVFGWDYRVNLDGRTGYATEINVSDPGWLLRATGWTGEQFAIPGDRYAKLDETCANGLKLWQNYVIDRADFGRKLVAAVVQSGSRVMPDSFIVHFPGVEALQNTGLNIRYRLDRKLRGESAFTQGELTDKYETNVPLGPHDPTGLYVFNMVLVPTNALDNGQSVLASVATVGVVRVSSPLTNTVTVAPWMSMATDVATNEMVAVSDVVNPNGLSAGDMIVAYDNATGKYNGWSYDSGSAWKAFASVTLDGVEVKEAETTQFAPGDAFWLARSKPTGNFYLVGRYTGCGYAAEIVGGTTAEPGATLVANPTLGDVAINDIDWQGKPLANDTITVPREGLAPLTLTWRKGAWGYTDSRYDPQKGRIVSTRVTDVTIPAGTGFWYTRRGEGFTITWPLAWPDVAQ